MQHLIEELGHDKVSLRRGSQVEGTAYGGEQLGLSLMGVDEAADAGQGEESTYRPTFLDQRAVAECKASSRR